MHLLPWPTATRAATDPFAGLRDTRRMTRAATREEVMRVGAQIHNRFQQVLQNRLGVDTTDTPGPDVEFEPFGGATRRVD